MSCGIIYIGVLLLEILFVSNCMRYFGRRNIYVNRFIKFFFRSNIVFFVLFDRVGVGVEVEVFVVGESVFDKR